MSRSGDTPAKRAARGALPGQADVEAHDVPVEQDIGEDHRDEGRDHAPVHARSRDQFVVRGRLPVAEVPAAGKARALGVAAASPSETEARMFSAT